MTTPIIKRAHFENPAKKHIDQHYVSVRHSPIRLLNYLSSSTQALLAKDESIPPKDLYLKVSQSSHNVLRTPILSKVSRSTEKLLMRVSFK